MPTRLLFVGVVATWAALRTVSALAAIFPGPDPGPAAARLDGDRIVLENHTLAVTWRVPSNKTGFCLLEFVDRLSGKTYANDPAASLAIGFSDGTTVRGSDLTLPGKPALRRLAAQPDAVRLADRVPGWNVSATMVSADGGVRIQWQATLRDGANYVRQECTLHADKQDLPLREWTVLSLPGQKVEGVVDGAPILVGNVFYGCEHPTAVARVGQGRGECGVAFTQPLRQGQSCRRTCVIGVAPAGQMRRAFLYYLQRERPRPYAPFLHYNSWYDIAWGDRKMNEGQCLDVIDLYGRELAEKRAVKLDSFVFDDGWDDNRTLWRFHGGFPRGFTPLQEAAGKCGSSIGVWLSPWGGYGQAQKERLAYGQTQGFETNARGFSLAGPKYYERFRDVCAEMVGTYRVNYFKFDGIAQGISSSGAGRQFAGDIEKLLDLTEDLRRLRRDLFINVTTGTWPSPFWLLWADSIWRNGGDMGFFGPGSKRQQWITYRDMIEYQWIVKRSPLYPINSLMTQGIAQARLGDASLLGSDLAEWKNEVRSFFASGTQLQELYVTPQMLTPAMWDVLAEGARWSRANADVLVDVHWIGGDPGQGQPYGFAAWSPRQAMLALRNPTTQPATIEVDVAQAFELPPGAPRAYRLTSPWKDAAAAPPDALRAGRPQRFAMAPFEVLVFDAVPEK